MENEVKDLNSPGIKSRVFKIQLENHWLKTIDLNGVLMSETLLNKTISYLEDLVDMVKGESAQLYYSGNKHATIHVGEIEELINQLK